MQRNPLVARKKALIFGVASGLLLLSLTTAQIALAGPSAGPSAQSSTIPTPAPTPPPPPALPPATANETTVSYNWADQTTTDVPLSDEEGAPQAQIVIPAKSMTAGGLPASGNITIQPVDAAVVPTIDSETVPDLPTVTFLGRSVQISVNGATAESGAPADITSQIRFNPPMVISFEITQEEWENAGMNPAAFQVRFYSTQFNQWFEVPTTVDPFSLPIKVQANVSHLTTFALFEVPIAPVPDGGDLSLGTGILFVMAALGVVLLGTGAVYIRRGSRQAA
jgi:hypothetical protein